jgi:hypothetical protein
MKSGDHLVDLRNRLAVRDVGSARHQQQTKLKIKPTSTMDVNPTFEEGFDVLCHHQWQVLLEHSHRLQPLAVVSV